MAPGWTCGGQEPVNSMAPESPVHPRLAGPSSLRPFACPLLEGVIYRMRRGAWQCL